MSELSENITIELFGLEKDLWKQTMDTERSVYGTAMWCYIGFLILACISSCMLVFLITGNIFSSIFGGILVALIIGSIVRFSMIILRRSIFDEIKVKENAATIIAKQPEATNSSVPVPPVKRFSKLKSLFRKLKFNWPTSHSKVPGFAGLIRLVIMTMMGLLVLFPLATLLHKSSIDELNDHKRAFYKQEFEKDANVAHVFAQMSEIELSHATAFAKKFNLSIDNLQEPSLRARILNKIGEIIGYDYVLGVLLDTEKEF